MAQTSLIQVRVDTKLKEQAERLFSDMGLDIPAVTRLFYRQCILRNKIPFSIEGSAISNPAETVMLSTQDWKRFSRELETPSAPNKNLLKLVKEFRI